jgi:hypothetical protein
MAIAAAVAPVPQANVSSSTRAQVRKEKYFHRFAPQN